MVRLLYRWHGAAGVARTASAPVRAGISAVKAGINGGSVDDMMAAGRAMNERILKKADAEFSRAKEQLDKL